MHLVHSLPDAYGARVWCSHTSIFIGILPIALPNGSPSDEKGVYAPVSMYNPVERRHQMEKLRVGRIIGIVLQGGTQYSWASQPLQLATRRGEYRFQHRTRSGAMDSLSAEIARCMRSSSHPAHIVASHAEQYHRMLRGESTRELRALLRLASHVKDHRIVCRMYGGGLRRVAMNFGALHDYHGIDSVPDQWNDDMLPYSRAARTLLVGYEMRRDGTRAYIRVSPRDAPLQSKPCLKPLRKR